MVGGEKRQLMFLSRRGRPLLERMSGKISESERVGRRQDIIREVFLLPPVGAEINQKTHL